MYITVFRNGRFYRETGLPPDDRPYVINWRGVLWLSEHFEMFSFTYKPLPWSLKSRFDRLTASGPQADADKLPLEIRAIFDEDAFRAAALAYREENPHEVVNGWFENDVLTCYPAVFEVGSTYDIPNYSSCAVTVDVRGAIHIGEGKVVDVCVKDRPNTKFVYSFHELKDGRFAGIRVQNFDNEDGDRFYYGELFHPDTNGSCLFRRRSSYEVVLYDCLKQLHDFDRNQQLIE